MKASASLKAACLTVGLATAWSPPLTQQAHADTVDVSLNIGTSGYNDPFAFNHVYVGLIFADGVEFHSIGSFASGIQGASFQSIESPNDTTEYVAFGVTPDAGEVMASVAAPDQFTSSFDWDTVFPGFDESDVFNQLSVDNPTFLNTFLAAPPANVMAGFNDTTTLFGFSDGVPTGNISLSIENPPDDTDPQPVPLPAGVMMGGVLLSLVFTGKVTRAWMSSREVPGLV